MIINLSTEFSVIKVSGSDASDFLQNQFSNDISLIDNRTSQISSYNSPKGRVYATFRILKTNDDYLLITTKSQIDFLVKRLSMFVMRSDVKIEAVCEQYTLYGLTQDYLDQNSISSTDAMSAVKQDDGQFFIRVLGEDKRYILLAPKDSAKPLSHDNSISIQDWLLSDIQAGMPHIYPETQEAFVAQMINLDLIDGVNFQKGCYPGQEIVARMKYLGKIKKRMFRISFTYNDEIKPGQAIYNNENEQSIGQIVYTSVNKDQYEALAVLNIEQVEKTSNQLFLDIKKQHTIKIEGKFS